MRMTLKVTEGHRKLYYSTAICHFLLPVYSSSVTVLRHFLGITTFTARRSYASAVLGVVILSVCHKRALWLIQRTYGNIFIQHERGNPSSFLMPKISSKFQRGHPQRGRQIEVGYIKTAIFDQHLAISHKRCKIGTYTVSHKKRSQLRFVCNFDKY